MTRKEHSLALRADTQVHYNCCQAVMIPFAADMGMEQEQANALGLNFGGGMGCGATCGALTGALMALGGLNLPQEQRLELIRDFRQAHGHLDCAKLLAASAQRGEEKKPHCDALVAWCMNWVSSHTGLE